MRWMWMSCALIAGLVSVGLLEAEDAAAPTPGDVATWVRSGRLADLERAAKAVDAMDAKQLREVFYALRKHAKMEEWLRKKRIKNLIWESATLDTAVMYLQTITGHNYYITPKVRTEKIEDISISLQIDDVSVRQLLDLITEPFGMTWGLRGGVVYVMTSEEAAPMARNEAAAPKSDPAAASLRAKIAATKINLTVKEQAFGDVVKILQIQTGFNIVIDPRVSGVIASVKLVGIQLSDAPLSAALTMLTEMVDDPNATWTVRGNVIVITSKEFVK